MDSDELSRGRAKLDAARYAADLSGKDYENVFLAAPETLSHSFLNGTSFRNAAFREAPVDQTELAEAEIIDCYFERVDFTGSSFIGATVENTTFRQCNFTDGEWRKSRFTHCTFADCDFNYTTINLCTFDNCRFAGEGSKRLNNRSVNYNVFTRSQFAFSISDDVVLASNFGFPSETKTQSLANYGASISLEEICLKSANGSITISEFVDAIEGEFQRTAGHRLKVLRLEFVSNIIVALAKVGRISATSLIYLENIFAALARSAKSETDALAAMAVVLSIRSLLLDITEESRANGQHDDKLCESIHIYYPRTYERSDAQELARILGELSNDDSSTFSLARFARGSTIIDLVTAHAVSVGAALVAINFALRQANVTLTRAGEVGASAMKLLRSLKRKPSKKKASRPVSRVPALQRSGGATKAISSLRRTVANHGYHAILVDDKAEVTVRYVSSK